MTRVIKLVLVRTYMLIESLSIEYWLSHYQIYDWFGEKQSSVFFGKSNEKEINLLKQNTIVILKAHFFIITQVNNTLPTIIYLL